MQITTRNGEPRRQPPRGSGVERRGAEEPRVELRALRMPARVSVPLPWEAGLLCGSPAEKQL